MPRLLGLDKNRILSIATIIISSYPKEFTLQIYKIASQIGAAKLKDHAAFSKVIELASSLPRLDTIASNKLFRNIALKQNNVGQLSEFLPFEITFFFHVFVTE